jgi:cytochrome c553
MRISLVPALLVMLSGPALAYDVPFAAPSPFRLGSPNQTYFASLADIMNLTQARHLKLWRAGHAGNWNVASFEVRQMRDTFANAAMFYDQIPIDALLAVAKGLDEVQRASVMKDENAFTRAFSTLTTSCNACHRAAGVGFIVIATPTSASFTDQKF